MMRILIPLALIILTGCNDGEEINRTDSNQPDPNPRIDTDVTPPSGSGGETQAAKPDGTTSDAQKTLPNQPTPTD